MFRSKRRKATRGFRVRRSHPNFFTDTFSDLFDDNFELGDDVADEVVGGGPRDAAYKAPSGAL